MKNLFLTFIILMNCGSLFSQVKIDSITWGALDQHETAIAVGPINPKYVIATWNDFRSNFKSEPGYAVSSDGGLTWFVKGLVPDINMNLTYGFDPSCGFDRNGNTYYCYNTYRNDNGNRGPVYISKSTDFGINWSHIQVSIEQEGLDKPYMAVDNTGGPYDGRVYVVWWNSSVFYTAYMPKNSSTFQGQQSLTNNIKWGFTSAVGLNGNIFLICRKTKPGRFQIYKSNNGGVSYTLISEVPYKHYDNPYDYITLGKYSIWANPSYAIDHNTGYHYITYSDSFSTTIKPRVCLKRSTDGGYNWEWIKTISESQAEVFYPWISVDPSGRLSLSYLKHQNNVIYQYYWESYDNGETFVSPANYQGTVGLVDIPGNPTVYATNFNNDFSMNTASLDKTTILYWKHLTSPNRTDIYRAIVKPFYTTSNTLSATAGASNRKIIYSGNQWHRVFISNKQLYYSYSTDDGINWDGYDVVSDTFDLSDISNPSLTAYGDTLHAIFTAEERKIYYARKVGSQNWQTPKLIYTAPQTLFGVASAVDPLRKGHVTWIEDNGMLLSTQVMKHGTFAVHSVNPAISGISTVQNGYGMINPGMDYDITGTPHVVWQQNEEIYYKYKTGTYTWSSALNLSNSASDPSTHPAIELIYNSPHVVWQENIDDNNEIYYRYKGTVWSATANVSASSGDSKHPCILYTINGPIIIWGEVCSVKYYLPDMDETGVIDSHDNLYTNYPSVGLRSLTYGGNRLIVQWTDQFSDHLDQAPYRVGHKPFEMEIKPFFAKQTQSLSGVPDDYTLLPNYPNPFNPSTQITFGLPSDTRVTVKIYDVLGREVMTMTDQDYKAGYHSVHWNGVDNKGNRVSSSVYIYRMITKDKSMCRKMLLIK